LKLSYNWLNDYIELNKVPFEKVLEKINLSICEIDQIEEYNPLLNQIICVSIINKEIFNDNKLARYEVSDKKNKFQIISGDLNLNINDKVPLAIPGIKVNEKVIEITKIKGLESYGMFCSQKDLNLSDENSSVMILNEFIINEGDNLKKIEELNDHIFTIDNKSITHRPDLWSHFGFARELAAQLELKIIFDPLNSNFLFNPIKKINHIKINKSKYVHSYKGIIINDVKIEKSKFIIRNRLEKCGIRSINNIVDISNYVLLEIGQPTHFFDLNKLGDIDISIDKGDITSKIELLDDTTRSIENCLVIKNSYIPVALAGIMGGKLFSVSDSTTNLFLESAVFRREEIRRSIRLTGLRTEASVRYEKGLNPMITDVTIIRILELLFQNENDQLQYSEIYGFDNGINKYNYISLSFDFIRKKLGSMISDTDIIKILEKLNFKVKREINDYRIEVPTYRSQYDILIKEDLVEEVGRTLGYSNIPLNPVASEIMPTILNDSRKLERELKEIFSYHLNYNEVYNYSFNSEDDITFEGKKDFSIKLKNSMPIEYNYLRTSLYPGIIHNIILNKDRFNEIKIYELGRVYFKEIEGLGSEEKILVFSEYYSVNDPILDSENILLEMREKIIYVLKKLNIPNIYLEDCNESFFHPTSGIKILSNRVQIAQMGILHPSIMSQKGLKKKVYIGKIYYNNLLNIYINNKVSFNFHPPSIFPQDSLDISILMHLAESTDTYANNVKKSKIMEIENIFVTSVYKGESISTGLKSVTYHIELITYNETFSQSKIKTINDKIINIAIQLGYQVR
jgi:phenylalanyl-tRNA synthetase beta chain